MDIRNMLTKVAVLSALCLAGIGIAAAQEVTGGATTSAKAMAKAPTAITQAMLDAAGGDAKNWIHPNGSYEQTR